MFGTVIMVGHFASCLNALLAHTEHRHRKKQWASKTPLTSSLRASDFGRGPCGVQESHGVPLTKKHYNRSSIGQMSSHVTAPFHYYKKITVQPPNHPKSPGPKSQKPMTSPQKPHSQMAPNSSSYAKPNPPMLRKPNKPIMHQRGLRNQILQPLKNVVCIPMKNPERVEREGAPGEVAEAV